MWMVAKGIIGARWFPYVLIGSLTAVGLAYGWGYLKGYDKAEDKMMLEMNKALESQMERLMTRYARQMKLAIDNAEKKHEIRKRVDNVKRPSISCELSPQCVQWYDDVMREARAGRSGIIETMP